MLRVRNNSPFFILIIFHYSCERNVFLCSCKWTLLFVTALKEIILNTACPCLYHADSVGGNFWTEQDKTSVQENIGDFNCTNAVANLGWVGPWVGVYSVGLYCIVLGSCPAYDRFHELSYFVLLLSTNYSARIRTRKNILELKVCQTLTQLKCPWAGIIPV